MARLGSSKEHCSCARRSTGGSHDSSKRGPTFENGDELLRCDADTVQAGASRRRLVDVLHETRHGDEDAERSLRLAAYLRRECGDDGKTSWSSLPLALDEIVLSVEDEREVDLFT